MSTHKRILLVVDPTISDARVVRPSVRAVAEATRTRLAARGVLTGSPRGQVELSEHRAAGDDVEAFLLDSGFADSVLHAAVLDDAP